MKTKKEKNFENTSWNFKLDKVHLYSYWKDAFTKQECEKIIKIAKKKGLVKGETYSKLDVRKSQVSWLYPSDDMEWAFRRVTDIVLDLNENTCRWEAPVAYPDDDQDYKWNEQNQTWDLINNI